MLISELNKLNLNRDNIIEALKYIDKNPVPEKHKKGGRS